MQASRPQYWQALANYPPANPVLITQEYSCLKIINNLQGLCLFCIDRPEITDFSCCFLREIWVLYQHKRYLQDALDLALAIQQSGASEISVVRLGL